MDAIKTPAAWCEQLNIKIYDPDGWRHDGKSLDEPIDEDEFLERCMMSTTGLVEISTILAAREKEAC